MIKVLLSRNGDGSIWAFSVDDHGGSEACACVSLLVINTVNSIETLTGADFRCDYEKSGGRICFSMPRYKKSGGHRDAGLLLEAMAMGLRDTAELFPKDISIEENKSEKAGS